MTTAPADGASGARWIDSHCHLQDRYRPEGDELFSLLSDAVLAGVTGVVCVGTDAQSSRQAVELARSVRVEISAGAGGGDGPALPGDFGVWATMGLHPHDASQGVDELARAPSRTSSAPDAVWSWPWGSAGSTTTTSTPLGPRSATRSRRRSNWRDATISPSSCMRATRGTTRSTCCGAVGPPERTVLHCFTGGASEARRCLDIGAFLSFSGIVTFKGAQDVRDAAALCPFDRLMVETDAPFLAPVPHRGKQNRPAWVADVGEAVAQIKGVASAALAETCTTATRVAFALS